MSHLKPLLKELNSNRAENSRANKMDPKNK